MFKSDSPRQMDDWLPKMDHTEKQVVHTHKKIDEHFLFGLPLSYNHISKSTNREISSDS